MCLCCHTQTKKKWFLEEIIPTSNGFVFQIPSMWKVSIKAIVARFTGKLYDLIVNSVDYMSVAFIRFQYCLNNIPTYWCSFVTFYRWNVKKHCLFEWIL